MKFYWFIWIPRIVMIIMILFIGLFSLDAFEGNESIWHKLAGFLIHNIPSIALTLVLILTWKRPLWGGLIFLAVTTALTILWRAYNNMQTFLIFVVPLIIACLLFILAHFFHPHQPEKPGATEGNTRSA